MHNSVIMEWIIYAPSGGIVTVEYPPFSNKIVIMVLEKLFRPKKCYEQLIQLKKIKLS